MFDAAIIGTGPAGLSAAINLTQLGKSIIWFGSPAHSAKVEKSETIANYPGLGLISGTELNQRFKEHAEALHLTVTDAIVTTISHMKKGFMLLADNEIYQAKTLVLAIGATSGKGLPGEAELLGKGVSYCATCDGFLYKGKTIAVCCYDRRYEHEVPYLAGLAGKVYLYVPYRDCGVRADNVTLLSSPVARIDGNGRVEQIGLVSRDTLPVDGVFILRNSVAPATLLPDLAMDGPHIVVSRSMSTNIPGCFACGDCTGRPYQIAKSVGEGNVAAHSAVEYIDTENNP